ncbi:MAG: VWA domain-containing protein [Gemmatimonadaceae bacterium]|nr:VWA domain-containing protein [Gemmatimonadaceae bacterium]
MSTLHNGSKRSRSRLRVVAVAGLLAALAGAALPAQDVEPPAVNAKLVRCHPAFRVPCFLLEDPRGRAVHAGAADPFTPMMRQQGAFIGPPTYLTVLVDVSGSMAPTALIAVRRVLEGWLQSRRADRDRLAVSVATFGSRQVRQRIVNAPFRSPEAALEAVRQLPSTRGSENTALYSAVEVAARQLLTMEPDAPGIRRALLVLSDGRNDVQPEDRRQDAALLGDEQLPRVRALLDSAAVIPILLGFGDNDAIARPALDSLAGTRGRVFTSPILELGAVGELVDSANAVLFPPQRPFVSTSDVSTLSRMRRNAGVERDDGRIALTWRPPLVTLAGFSGSVPVAAADTAYEKSIAALVVFPLERLIAVFVLGLGLALLWLLVPAWLWPPVVVERNVVREVAEIAPDVTPVTPTRRRATEAPPRMPDAITGEFPIPS